MRYFLLIVVITFSFLSITFAQNVKTGINTTSPKAVLQVDVINPSSPTNEAGITVPTIDEFPTISPGDEQNGMLVYLKKSNSASTGLNGFYYWDAKGGRWEYITQSKSIKLDLSKVVASGNSFFPNPMTGGSNANVVTPFKSIDSADPSFSLNSESGLVIGKTGTYYIFFTGGVTKNNAITDNTAENFTVRLFVNGISQPSLTSTGANPSVLNNKRSTTFTISTIVTLQKGDVLIPMTQRSSATNANTVEVSVPYFLTMMYLD